MVPFLIRFYPNPNPDWGQDPRTFIGIMVLGFMIGVTGHIFNVATDPPYRRRGYSRTCMVALLEWYQRRGVPRVELNASPDGERLYQELGFARTGIPAMRRSIPPRPR